MLREAHGLRYHGVRMGNSIRHIGVPVSLVGVSEMERSHGI